MIVVGLAQDKAVFDSLNAMDEQHNLCLDLSWQPLAKTNQASLIGVSVAARIFVGIIKNTPMLLCYTSDDKYQHYEMIKTFPNWESLTRRVVTAGRKSELLLQACKLLPEKTVIDGTAGFGHDSLILASTGASVTMIEQNPLMFLLLTYEMQKMQANPNWQKLLSRMTLRHGNATEMLPTLANADVVYLDPMFPDDSYKSAQVGKQMQALHTLACPPTPEQARELLSMAKNQLTPSGRVVVKRPKIAPYLADVTPQASWQNAVIRYDGYF